MSDTKKPYFDNVDALRFFAAMAVFLFHVSRDLVDFFSKRDIFQAFNWVAKITDKGALGVNFFFVLSGFLITYLMIWEVERTGSFSYKKFLLRRTLRIWPLYFAVIILGFWVFPAILDAYHTEHQQLNYWLFLANFDEINHGASDGINFLTSPWSIAVEEQFYIIWGLLGLIFLSSGLKRLSYLKHVLFALLALSILFRTSNFQDERMLYYHTLSVMPDLLIGCLLALLWYENTAFFNLLKHMKRWKIITIYVFGFSMLLGKNLIFKNEFLVAERYVIALFFAFVISDQIVHNRRFNSKVLHERFSELGKTSYGIYMYHLMVLYLLNTYWFSKISLDVGPVLGMLWSIVYLIGSFLLVMFISKLSYQYFELPFLKLKDRFYGQ